ncbi:MAG: HlyD family efflux transporter periplasmic adaptor subunit, partial [Bacteroidetes bacterium]
AAQEYALAQANYLRFDSLFRLGYASQLEVDQAQAQALQAKFRLEQQASRQLENELRRERLKSETLLLTENLSDEVTTQWLGFKREWRKLQYEYQNWKEQYLLYAKTTGQLSLLSELRPGQQVKAGMALWGIIPQGRATQWVAVGKVSDMELGKIGVGDTALIRLPAFPYREYGQLRGTVSEIALLADTDEGQPFYRLVLELPRGLVTSYQRTIDARQSLSGQARIIGDKRSLLARIFDRLRQIKENLR